MAKVLVIDDTIDHLMLFKMMLEMKAYEVQTALNKETALPLLDSFKPDLVLLDVFLKDGISGRELCRYIKETHPSIFIILLSADQKSLEDYQLCGADGMIEKPFEITTVFNTIEDLLMS